MGGPSCCGTSGNACRRVNGCESASAPHLLDSGKQEDHDEENASNETCSEPSPNGGPLRTRFDANRKWQRRVPNDPKLFQQRFREGPARSVGLGVRRRNRNLGTDRGTLLALFAVVVGIRGDFGRRWAPRQFQKRAMSYTGVRRCFWHEEMRPEWPLASSLLAHPCPVPSRSRRRPPPRSRVLLPPECWRV